MHVGFDVDPPAGSGPGSTGGPLRQPNGYHSAFDMRSDNDRDHDDEYSHQVTLDGSRPSGGYDGLRGFIGGKPEDEQDGLGDALIKMKKRKYIQDAMVTGMFVAAW